MRSVDYKILEDTSKTTLESDVKMYLSLGWICQGGVFVYLNIFPTYYQALILVGPDIDPTKPPLFKRTT